MNEYLLKKIYEIQREREKAEIVKTGPYFPYALQFNQVETLFQTAIVKNTWFFVSHDFIGGCSSQNAAGIQHF